MQPKLSYTLVGLFVLALGAALAAGVIWLAAGQNDQSLVTYVAYMHESVSGLNREAPVKYRGVEVGQVRDIALDHDDPRRVRLLLDLREGTPVKTDTLAILATQGITGIAYVDLTGGSREAPLLKPRAGKPYAEIPTGPSLLVRLDQAVSTLLTDMGRAAEDLSSVAERVNRLLDDTNQQAITHTLQHVDTVTGALAGNVDAVGESLQDASRIMRNSVAVSAELPQLISRVDRSVAGAQDAIAAITRAASRVDVAVQETQQALLDTSAGTLDQVRILLSELQDLTRSLQRSSQEFDRNPNILLFGRPQSPPGPGE